MVFGLLVDWSHGCAPLLYEGPPDEDPVPVSFQIGFGWFCIFCAGFSGGVYWLSTVLGCSTLDSHEQYKKGFKMGIMVGGIMAAPVQLSLFFTGLSHDIDSKLPVIDATFDTLAKWIDDCNGASAGELPQDSEESLLA